MSKSIALLICDTPMPSVLLDHGDYLLLFTDLLHASATQLGVVDIKNKCKIDGYDVVNKMEYPADDELNSYDAIMITGSKASAYDDIEWINKLVDYVARVTTVKPKLKFIGICFGHQIIARAMGGSCVPNGGKWEIGPTLITLTDVGKQVFGVEAFNIQEMHRDHVPQILPGFHLLGSTDVSYNQGMVRFHSPAISPTNISLSDVHIFTVQGHPEFTQPIITKIIEARTMQGVIDEATAADAVRRAGLQNDGVAVVGKAIWGVLGVSGP